MSSTVCPLGFLAPGGRAEVQDVCGGRRLRRRLSELGIVRGSVVGVVQCRPCGPIIVALGDGRVALGRGVAQKIVVKKLDGKAGR